MKFEFGNQLFDLLMNIFELAVPKFGDFNPTGDFILNFDNIDYFIIQLSLMAGYFNF